MDAKEKAWKEQQEEAPLPRSTVGLTAQEIKDIENLWERVQSIGKLRYVIAPFENLTRNLMPGIVEELRRIRLAREEVCEDGKD